MSLSQILFCSGPSRLGLRQYSVSCIFLGISSSHFFCLITLRGSNSKSGHRGGSRTVSDRGGRSSRSMSCWCGGPSIVVLFSALVLLTCKEWASSSSSSLASTHSSMSSWQGIGVELFLLFTRYICSMSLAHSLPPSLFLNRSDASPQ